MITSITEKEVRELKQLAEKHLMGPGLRQHDGLVLAVCDSWLTQAKVIEALAPVRAELRLSGHLQTAWLETMSVRDFAVLVDAFAALDAVSPDETGKG